ncbi:MAG: hypothetical protein Q4F05_04670 [bacterium]|nr:hypothetical protein [bacterium]
MHKKIGLILCFILAITALSGCMSHGEKDTVKDDDLLTDKEERITPASSLLPYLPRETVNETQSPAIATEKVLQSQTPDNRIIADQSFDATLTPLGDVRFVSYQPLKVKSKFEDVTFQIERNGQAVLVLPGVEENNIRESESFQSVEAVSFPDYNNDGYSDIITICKYINLSDNKSETSYTEARIYSGSKKGTFSLEKTLMKKINDTMVKKTIQDILSVIKSKQEEPENKETPWKQAYLNYLKSETTEVYEGYNLIYVNNDDIPELVEVGESEAIGCKVLTYYNGQVNATQLSRLYFSYIPKQNLLCNSDGNMGVYYDVVYSIKNGKLTQIAEGIYGDEDNAKPQFDENGNEIFVYKWNGNSVTKEDYEQSLNAIYNTKKAIVGGVASFTLEELKAKLK